MSQEARSFYVERDGVRLHALEEGNREGPLVVLVHGYPDDLTVWDGVVGLLSDAFHILRYDVRGAGLSDTPKRRRDYAMVELKDDLLAVVDTIRPGGSFHLVGHDWGSIQLWETVMDPVASQRVLSFVSASGPSIDYVAEQSRAALTSGDPADVVKALKQAARSWYIMMFQLPVLPELAWSPRGSSFLEQRIAASEGIPLVVFRDRNRARNGRDGVALYRANMLPRLLAPKAKPSSVPTRVLVLSADPYVSESVAHSCEKWLSSVEFVPVDGGHWFYVARPEIFADAIASFVRANS